MPGDGGTSASGGAVGSSDRADAGTDAADIIDATQACLKYCGAAAACGVESGPECEDECARLTIEWDEPCRSLKGRGYACLAAQDCASIAGYADDQGSHTACGQGYTNFAAACLDNGGVPPQPCADFCNTFGTCEPDLVAAVPGCSNLCLEQLTVLIRSYGPDCSVAVQQRHACIVAASAENGTPVALITHGLVPPACTAEYEAVTDACQ